MRTLVGDVALCLKGDKTTHNGVILTGSAHSSVHGIPIARLGDKVFCPKCKPHISEIVEGKDNYTDRGVPVALQGHLTSCGAQLISSPAAPAIQKIAEIFLANSKTPQSLIESADREFNQFFCLLDQATGEPIKYCLYSLTINDQIFFGMTDAKGNTEKVSADKQAEVEIEIIVLEVSQNTKESG